MSSSSQNGNPRLKRLPAHMIPEDIADLILERLDRGFPAPMIVKELLELYPNHRRRRGDLLTSFKRYVQRVQEDRDSWSTIRSPQNMKLAYDGNAQAFEELTFFERLEVLNDIFEHHYAADKPHPLFPDLGPAESATHWAEAVGLNPQWFNRAAVQKKVEVNKGSIYRRKMTFEKAQELRRLRTEENMSVVNLCNHFGIGTHAVYDIINGKRWVEQPA